MRILTAMLLAALPLAAQHDMTDMPDMPGMDHSKMGHHAADPMEASGTSRNPASSPGAMVHLNINRWMLMFHGAAFIADIQQTGPRGADKLASANWVMAEAEHSLAGGTFAVRTMLSLEPATVTGRVYPELFQTGETAFGKAIVDGQHPHNFVMEAALEYRHKIAEHASWEIYAAPVGDPALGPVAFPHRISAAELPQATLGHHLEDSTHISDDVITAGIVWRALHLEASGFHGGEPNENRWTVAYGKVDSWSTRLSIAPTRNWNAQVSIGHLANPEALEPGDQNRVAASATYNRPFRDGNWTSTFIWGRVHKLTGRANLNGYTAESVARFLNRNYATARIEVVDKDELPVAGTFRVQAWTGGYTRDFLLIPHLATGLGANFTAYAMDPALHRIYGNRPVAILLFVRFRLRDAS